MQDIAPLLEQLATKLGTTSEYLWAVMVNGIIHEAYISLAILIFFGGWAIFALFLGLHCYKKSQTLPPDKREGLYMSCGCLWIASACYFFLALPITSYNIYLKLAVSEAQALKRILALLSS